MNTKAANPVPRCPRCGHVLPVRPDLHCPSCRFCHDPAPGPARAITCALLATALLAFVVATLYFVLANT